MTAPKTPVTSGWDDLVYNLFYPSILGSIIFDYVDPLRFGDTNRLFLLPVLLIFIIDYWHMKNNIHAHEGSKWGFRLIDIGVTLLFLVSYYTFSYAFTKTQTNNALPPHYASLLLKGLVLIVIALGLVLIYDLCRFGRAILSRVCVSIIVILIVFVVAYITHGKVTPCDVPIWFRFFSIGMMALYALYVATWPKSLAQ
jgi:hypothetical protein